MSGPMRALARGMRCVVARVLSPVLSLFASRSSPGAIERILVIRVDPRVGNLLLTTPLFDALRERFPEATLEVLVDAAKARVVEGIVSVVPFDKRALFVRPWSFVRTLRALRERYDVAIDASHWHRFSLSSAILLAWTGAPVRIAHDRGAARRFATCAVPVPEGREPEVLSKLRLLEPLGIEPKTRVMRTALGDSERARARAKEWLAERGLDGKAVVGLAPGARKLDHRAPVELFLALGALARELGAAPLVLWGPGEERLAEDLAERARAALAPPTDLDLLAAFLRACRAVVCNDTGPMHLAVACGTPTLALFRRSDPVRWGHAEGGRSVSLDDEHGRERALDALREMLGVGPRS